MIRRIEVPFVKFHGLGNDFIVVAGTDLFKTLRKLPDTEPAAEAEETAVSLDLSSIARSICDRHTGVGADGLLLMLPPKNKKHHGRMLVLNADGSEAEMSGNGIRCAAAYLVESARRQPASALAAKAVKTASRLGGLQIETAVGARSLEMLKARKGKWTFRIGMGEPILEPEKLALRRAHHWSRRRGQGRAGGYSAVVGFPLHTSHGELRVTVTSMGNPHCSVFVDNFDAIDWPSVGREIENSPLFTNRTNVEFVKVISRGEIEVRFWERGVGQTASSGTGSCGAAVACILNGLTDRKIRVRTLAGILDVAWPEKGEVRLTGPVELIARGTFYCRL